MNIIHLEHYVSKIGEIVWGLPLLFFIIIASMYLTYIFCGLQFTKFFSGWKSLLGSEEKVNKSSQSISAFQAFISALSASLGNGGVAGMATVLVDGGPGTIVWIFVLGFIGMIFRFAEVFGAMALPAKKSGSLVLFGPFKYISHLPFGGFFVRFYAIAMFVFVVVAGIAMQTNSIGTAINNLTGLDGWIIGCFFVVVLLYILLGGSQRIMKFAEIVIPIKVILFFILIFVVLGYHYHNIIPVLKMVWDDAFQLSSCAKGAAIVCIKNAFSVSFSRGINATESGLGTAAIFFDSTDSKDYVRSGVMSMMTALISTNLVCCLMLLALMVCGVGADSHLTGAALVIYAFKSVFGFMSSPLITFLGLSFGLGVLVAYSFLGIRMWTFLFGKSSWSLMVCKFVILLCALGGTLSSVNLVWKVIDVLVGILIFVNIAGVCSAGSKLKELYRKNS